MKHLFILTFILVYFFSGSELGYTGVLPVWNHFTYNFQHGSIMHLVINSIVFFLFFRTLQNYFTSWQIAIASLASAFIMSFFCIYDLPVVGASGMIYAMIGMYFFLLVTSRMTYRDPLHLYVFLLSISAMLVAGFLKENSAGLLHLLCLIAGFLAAMWIKKGERIHITWKNKHENGKRLSIDKKLRG